MYKVKNVMINLFQHIIFHRVLFSKSLISYPDLPRSNILGQDLGTSEKPKRVLTTPAPQTASCKKWNVNWLLGNLLPVWYQKKILPEKYWYILKCCNIIWLIKSSGSEMPTKESNQKKAEYKRGSHKIVVERLTNSSLTVYLFLRVLVPNLSSRTR